jgi:hypothetical protein
LIQLPLYRPQDVLVAPLEFQVLNVDPVVLVAAPLVVRVVWGLVVLAKCK